MEWLSPEQQADKLPLLEKFDGHAGLRNGLRRVAQDRGDWAGIPMPLENEALVIEPTYPKADELMAMCGGKPVEPPPGGDIDRRTGKKILGLRNQFFSSSKRAWVLPMTLEGERVVFGLKPDVHSFEKQLSTLGVQDAWGIEQEAAALQTLGKHVRHRQFKQYLLTGMFLERSERSGVHYCFRKLRPTVAMNIVKGNMHILCALCMHPIGYYQGTWAGVMTPTDDVIAHLMMMRADEHMLWRRCNQHPAWSTLAGL